MALNSHSLGKTHFAPLAEKLMVENSTKNGICKGFPKMQKRTFLAKPNESSASP